MEWKTNYRMYVVDSTGTKCIGGKDSEAEARQYVADFCAQTGCSPYALVPTTPSNQIGRLGWGEKITLDAVTAYHAESAGRSRPNGHGRH